ncbi:MAG: ETC complex I subunit [Rickettsiales endosymbiont of Dermacentor nuttalli]
MQARIYKPTKTAMQSGIENTKKWILEFEYDISKGRRYVESIMGWVSGADMRQEIRLCFDSKEEAIRFAINNNIPYTLVLPQIKKIKPKSYADNFIKRC